MIRCALCGLPVTEAQGGAYRSHGYDWIAWHAPWEHPAFVAVYPNGFCFHLDKAATLPWERLVKTVKSRDPRRVGGVPPWY